MTANQILSSLEWPMLFSLATAALIARLAIPPIVRTSISKNLVAKVSRRTSHTGKVPYMGGIAIFASLAISSSLFAMQGFTREIQFVLPALVIIFFLGLKDDIEKINPISKLIGQIIASLIVIILADVRITSFHGLLGIHGIGVFPSLSVSLVVFLGLVNAFNLIDGIDGLASGLGIQISVLFGFWLSLLGQHDYAVLAFALTGGLIPFYIYNVFGKKNKLFMGDTGSLLIGMVFSVLAMKVLSFEVPTSSFMYFPTLPVLVISAMIIPISDTIRLFILRMAKGKSPFHADRNHFHHYLISLGMSHWQASTVIIVLNAGLFLLAFKLRHIGNIKLGILIIGLSVATMQLTGMLVMLKRKNFA